MPGNNISLHRVLKATPEKVYRAFTEANALAAWLPPYGFFCIVHQMEMHVGGKYKMSFTNFSTGTIQSFGGTYLEIEPNRFLKYIDQFDDPNLPGETTTTVWFKKVSIGTELTITQENMPLAIPVDGCYFSWQECLDKLAKLVEPEIAD